MVVVVDEDDVGDDEFANRALCVAYAKCFDNDERIAIQAMLSPTNAMNVYHNLGTAPAAEVKRVLRQCKAISRVNKEWAARSK